MITLSYPLVDPSVVLTLSDPDLGNSDTEDMKLTIHRSRSNKVRTYIRRVRPGRRIFKTILKFSRLRKAKIRELRDFLVSTSGRYFLYTDFRNNEWICKFNENTFEVTAVGRSVGCTSDDERHEVSFTIDRWANEDNS